MDINIYSRESIENLIESGFPANTAVISFYDPPCRIAGYDDYAPVDYCGKAERLLQIELNDIDPFVLKNYSLTYETYFPEAEKVAEFIYSAYNDGMDIICQCEMGQSRSAGCAAAISEHFFKNGIDIFTDYRYYPNQMVYHKVFDSLNEYKNTYADRE